MNLAANLDRLFQKYNDVSLTEAVYLTLKNAICSGVLHAGDKLGELELSEIFKVSRTPIQKALVRLECESLVENEPMRGYRVKRMSYSECIECNEFYLAMYTASALMAMHHGIDNYYHMILLKHLTDMEQETDIMHYLALEDKFHSHIALSTKNRDLITSFRYVINKGRIMGMFDGPPMQIDEKQFIQNHNKLNARLYDLLKSGDVGQMSYFMEKEHNPQLRNLVNQCVRYKLGAYFASPVNWTKDHQ